MRNYSTEKVQKGIDAMNFTYIRDGRVSWKSSLCRWMHFINQSSAAHLFAKH